MDIKILDNGIAPSMLKPSTAGAAGIDLRAVLDNSLSVSPGMCLRVSAGIAVAIPKGFVGLISPRSGLGTKGLILGNLTGVIDSDYRGEIQVALWNRHETDIFVIEPYDRIAQLYIVSLYDYANTRFVEKLTDTVRGTDGFGSTGVQ